MQRRYYYDQTKSRATRAMALTLSAVLAFSSIALIPQKAYAATGTVTATSLYVRSGPGTGYSSIGGLRNGQTVTVHSVSGGWATITYNGRTAYVSADYLRLSDTNTETGSNTGTSSGSASIGTAVVTASSLNIRTGAGTSYRRIGGVSRNATVTLLAKSGSWYKISYNSMTGYVSGDYLRVTLNPTGGSSSGSTSNGGSNSGSNSSTTGIGTAKTTGSDLRMRTGASLSSSVITYLAKGVTVTVLERLADWSKVTYNGRTGYVSNAYLNYTPYPVEEEDDNVTEGDDTITEGGGNTTEGDDTTTEGGDNTTEGDDTTTEGGDNTTEGDDTTTEGGNNTTEGDDTTTEGGDNTTEGDDTTTEGGDNTTEGDDTTTEGGDNTTEGDDTTTEGGDNTTEGDDTTTEGGDNTTEGDDTTTEGGDSTTEGDDTTTEGGDAEDDSQQTATLYAKVDADALNVRKGPGTSYTSIDQIYDGSTVTVLDRGSSWSKILTEDGVIGYCSNDYLDFYSETGNTTTTITYATITASALCLRKGPGTGYGSMGYIRRGTRVLVEEKGSSWSKVTYDGKTGYMSNAYLSFSYETVEVVTYPYDAYVTASLLNLRTEPTQSSTAVVSIPYRTQVEVIAAAGSWLKINYTTEAGQTYTGYVDSAYISKQQPAEGNNDSTSGGTDSGDAIIDPNASTVQKIIQIALSQVGYTEGRNNDTKYGDALGKSNQPWCLIFVVWCARQAGVDTGVLPAIYSCNAMKNWMAARDRYYTRGSGYVPKPGDLVFLSWSSGGSIEHVGLVWKVEGNTLYTIEGNTSLDNGNEGVKWRTFDLSSGRIVGYGSPAYND